MKTENKKFLKSMRPRLNFLIVLMLITSLLHLFGIVHTSQNCKNKYGDKVYQCPECLYTTGTGAVSLYSSSSKY